MICIYHLSLIYRVLSCQYVINIIQIATSPILLDFGVNRVSEGAARDQYASVNVLNFFRC